MPCVEGILRPQSFRTQTGRLSLMNEQRLAVIVGVAQCTKRFDDLADPLEPSG
jgi:hypothetical protein